MKNIFLFLVLLTTWAISCANKKLPLIINTWGFTSATTEAWRVLNLSNSTTALDALVAGCSQCEIDQCDGTVGYGGSPDENAETTLDAMIMDGTTMNMGAVANLRQIKDAIKVARHVLENTRHSLLAGDQATEFAIQMGFEKQSLTTAKSKEMWKSWRQNNCQPNFWLANVTPNPAKYCGPYKPLQNRKENCEKLSDDIKDTEKFNFGARNHDTIGMVIIDEMNQIFAGTSTNGAKHKIPGRVGDSPIPGAGAYASDIGGAAATGDGDVMIRFLPSFTAVENLRKGLNIKLAVNDAIERILKYYPNFTGGIILASKDGDYWAACAGMEKFPFSVVNGGANEKVKIEYVQCNK